jgi:hypothetical protein
MAGVTSGSRNYTPHEYQKSAIKKIIGQACAGLLQDPGLGKTSEVLAATKILTTKKLIKGVLIIAPMRVCYAVWPAEIKKWLDFQELTCTILHGPAKWEGLKAKANIYLINPEGVPPLVEILLAMPTAQWPFDTLVVDESTKFKSAQSKRFKALRRILNKFRRRYILTGTIVPNGLLDLFGQIFILDQGAALGRFITHYKNQYFHASGFGGYTWLPRQGADVEIAEKIEPLVMRMRAQDYLEMPALQNNYINLDLPPAARKHYREMEEQFFTEITDEDFVMSANAAVAGGKCRQILNGALYINPEHDYKVIHDTKLEALEDLLEELSGQPLLVFYEFIHDMERIIEKFKCPKIGGQSMKKDAEIIGAFNAGVLPMVIAHPASAGHGLNLQGNCAHVCWFGLTWNLEHYDQALRRVWRQGNNAPRVVIHHMVVNNSLDEVVIRTLTAKDRTQARFMETIRALAIRV